MVIKDGINIFDRLVTIPSAFGIDHHHRPQFAAIKTSGGIDTSHRQTQFLGANLHVIAKLRSTLGIAASAFVRRGALVLAHENMRLIKMCLGRQASQSLVFLPVVFPAALNWLQKAF
eukprot:TRINITY_DN12088_c0_g1_i1.p1 TRINITY_DN12088_c0_g1~~TRINITY_DN12088_c0_g1_i1.p1  ORF type:complete len:117 (-),score=5.12 TRINITY_DN12088_c0_g1_i1:216-566(-)